MIALLFAGAFLLATDAHDRRLIVLCLISALLAWRTKTRALCMIRLGGAGWI